VDTATARFERVGDSVTLFLGGWPSSQWSLTDPADLEFEYMRWMLAALRATFEPSAELRCLHLGAGACALPRAIAALWPRSRHLAVEIDAALAAAVRRHVDLPRAPVLRIRVDDAVRALASRPPATHHLIVRDAFDQAGNTPTGLKDAGAARAAARALRPDGLYLANCGDAPPLAGARQEVRTLAESFAYVALATEPAQLRGRRRGNVMLAARHTPLTTAQEDRLARELRAGGFPARLIAGGEALLWAGAPRAV
jgi:spermidine synthase